MRRDPTEFRARFKAYKEGKMPYENGLPKYGGGKRPKGGGTRYLWDDQAKEWDRVTDDPMMRAFADLTVTPSGSRDDNRTNPVYHDPRLKYAGYVTESMLEDEENSTRQRETGQYAPGLEQVSPEFDLLMLGSTLRSNPLTQQLWRNRTLSKEMDKVFNQGLNGATKDMPVAKASDMYNPEHFRSTVRYNPKQIEVKQYASSKKHSPSSTDVEQVLNIPQLESRRVLALPQEEYTVPEASYTGRVPTRSYNLRDLQQGAGSNIIQSSGEVLNPTTPEQRPVVPQKLLPLNKRSEYVDSEGNVNMRNVVKAVRKFYANHPEARNYKEIMNWRDVPGVGQQQRNLYQHIRDVVKSAQQAPVPEGFTRQNLVQAAMFHDIGKVLNPDKSHGETSVDILKELGIHASYDVKHAIRRHMSHHLGDEDPLTKALHFVDVVRDTQPMSNTGAYNIFRNLLYPSNQPYKIRPLYSWDYDWQLNNIINPILREYGYDEIPLGLSKEETRKLVLDRAQEHRTFARGQHAFNSDNLKNATNQFIRREGRYPTEEELFDQGFEYYKEHGTTSGDRGAEEYMSKFELPYKKFMSLYTSNSGEVYRGYLRSTNADYAARALQLPVQDNPNWSLAELWGYNDYPLVYSPGGRRTPTWSSDWRYKRLPNILNFGNNATPSVITQEEADVINARNISQASSDAHEKARQEVVADIDAGKYKNAPKYYQTKPSYFMEVSSNPHEHMVSEVKTFEEPTLNGYYGTGITGYRKNPFEFKGRKTLSEAVSNLNDYLRQHGAKEVLPYAYSQLKPRKSDLLYSPGNPNPTNTTGYRRTVIKYPVALNNLLNQIEYIKLQDVDIPAHIPIILDRVTKKPKPAAYQYRGMSAKQIEAHNNANKPRINKDGIVVNAPLFVPDQHDPYGKGGYFVASNTKYVPDISKMIKDAVDQYYKDIKLARSKDAFIRRKIHQDDLNMFIETESGKLFDKYYVKPELVKPEKLAQNVDYPFTTQSFDGYRVFVTENNYGPGSGYQNNYILVGPRGAKAAAIDRNFKLDINNHGYTRGYDNVGRPVKGLTKNAM